MENINFYTPRHSFGKVKCTIHRSGNLGFSDAAAKELNLTTTGYVKFGKSDNPLDSSLYMVVTNIYDKECFGINKAGNYFYINTKLLFNDLKLDYLGSKIIFDISVVNKDNNIYKLVKREIERNHKVTQLQ
jgi:hypothetical protein